MLSVEDNAMLTQVGPGTPTGELFRRFWLPAMLSSELPEPDGEPVRLRLLGEDLVTYRDTDGRVIATIDDYVATKKLVEPVFQGSVSHGISKEIRETVEAVRVLTGAGTTATVSQVAERLKLSPSGAWHRVKRAICRCWLVNEEERRGHPAQLRCGEPLPDDIPALPAPQQIDSNVQTSVKPQVVAALSVCTGFERLNENARVDDDYDQIERKALEENA